MTRRTVRMRPPRWMWVLALLVLPAAPPLLPGGSGKASAFAPGRGASAGSPYRAALYGRLPMSFEANRGQAPSNVLYVAHTARSAVLLTRSGIFLSPPANPTPQARSTDPAGPQATSQEAIRFLGAHSDTLVVALDPLPGKVSYFLGNDPRRWHTDIPTYGRIEYTDLYPGIDLVVRAEASHLAYSWIVHPGADLSSVRLGVAEAGHPPRGWSAIAHQPGRPSIAVHVTSLGRGTIGLRPAAYDRTAPLIVDPTLIYSTYLGGSGSDAATGLAADRAGNVYLAGVTSSTDFPIKHAFQPSYAGSGASDTFVAKLSPAGDTLLYSTFLGGSGADGANGLTVDGTGNVYIVGYTSSPDFPVANPIQSKLATGTCSFPAGPGDCRDAFVTKIAPGGNALGYSTYLGGSNDDVANGVAVDGAGNVTVVGETQSADFPVTHALQGTIGGGTCSYTYGRVPCRDAFVARLGPSGTTLLYGTYLGGTGEDSANAVAVDASGNAYVTGVTNSPDFPTHNALQSKPGGGICSYSGLFVAGNIACYDAFVTKLSPAGDALLYSTYLGGSHTEFGWGIAVDGSGSAYVTGQTDSADYPTSHAFQSSLGGGTCNSLDVGEPCNDAFVARLTTSGGALVYSTFLGGNGDDEGRAIAVDATGDAYLTGATGSASFPIVHPVQSAFGGGTNDAFFTELAPDGSSLSTSTYLGGSVLDEGLAIALDGSGGVYVAGITSSGDFPAAHALQPVFAGGPYDAFVAKLYAAAAPALQTTPPAQPTSLTASTPVGTATAVPTSSPTSTQAVDFEVSVISVRIEPRNAKPDWNLSSPSVASVHAGTSTTLSVYYTVVNGRPNDTIKDQWTVRSGKRLIWRRQASHALGRTSHDLFRDRVLYTFRKRGSYSYVGRVTVRGTSDAGITSIRVTARRRK